MNEAIYELKSIASMFGKSAEKEIDKWIENNIKEGHVKIHLSIPGHEDHKKFQIEKAMNKLGKLIAENSNMYPTFSKEENVLVCRMSALYFKNEFGK